MKRCITRRDTLRLLLAAAPMATVLSACSAADKAKPPSEESGELDTSRFLVAIEDEPDTVDFQCTSIYYTIATNVFDRLVETVADKNGSVTIEPSLAESWDISDDRRSYTFHLRKGVTFSNGSELTSDDVLYSFSRLLTHPDSCNVDIVEPIVGAGKLAKGETDQLEGFKVLSDLDFTITLEQPFEAFLACISMPGASIMDRESAEAAGERFGLEPKHTVGTGSFVLQKWVPGEGMILTANPTYWGEPPHCEGLDLRFVSDPAEACSLYEDGDLDVLDLDEAGSLAEYFLHGDIYQDRLYQTQRLGTSYIALNESVPPLDDVRVRKALQLALNRKTLLDAIYSGMGTVENGIYPHGLYGFNPDLPEIPYSPEEARALLRDAGCADGFDLEFNVKSSSAQSELSLVKQAVSMWEAVGVRAIVTVLDEDEFMRLRKSGELACYTALWTADYDDPDNFIYTFFGNRDNTTFRSLCYTRDDIMERVHNARMIADVDARLKEYRDLEQIIIQEDAAWIPLFSRQWNYVTSERVKGITSTWNGSVKNVYREITIKKIT